jgi:glycosyltransferase involved in cell wall biosynthesis
MVDILIPTYNRSNTIINSIQSALAQKKIKVNVHVIDNNSSDNTLSLIKEKFIKCENLFIHEFNTTVPMIDNWNRCLEFISFNYFKFLFSDDLLSPDFTWKCLEIMESNSNIDLIATDLNYFDTNENNILKIRKYNTKGYHIGGSVVFRSLLSRNNISAPSNSLIRSLSIDNIKFIDNRVASDWIFFSSILIKNKNKNNYFYLEEPLSYFRTTGDTETNQLKMSSLWVSDNYKARIHMSKPFNWFKKQIIKVFTLLYCSIVLSVIRKQSLIEFEKSKIFLKNNSILFNPIFYFINSIMKIKIVENYFLNK